jgi:hypothetical protein
VFDAATLQPIHHFEGKKLWGAVEHEGVVYVLQATTPPQILVLDSATLAPCAESILLPTFTQPRRIAVHGGRLFVLCPRQRAPLLWVYVLKTKAYSLHEMRKFGALSGLAVTSRFVVTLRPEGVEFWLHSDNYRSRYAMNRRVVAKAMFATDEFYVLARGDGISRHLLPTEAGDIHEGL